MGEKGVGKLSRETPPPREGEPMGAKRARQRERDRERESAQFCFYMTGRLYEQT